MRKGWVVAVAVVVAFAVAGAGCGGGNKEVVRTVTAPAESITAAGPTQTTTAAGNDCASHVKANPTGPPTVIEGTCSAKGLQLTLVKQSSLLRLKTLTARVVGVRLADSVSPGDG